MCDNLIRVVAAATHAQTSTIYLRSERRANIWRYTEYACVVTIRVCECFSYTISTLNGTMHTHMFVLRGMPARTRAPICVC